MGRKNNRMEEHKDNNFQKFIDDFNKSKVINNKPKINLNNNTNREYKQFKDNSNTDYKEKIRIRLEFALDKFNENNIEYEVVNKEKGVVKLFVNNTEYIFFASTGMLKGIEDLRGLKNVINYLLSL